MGGNVFSDTRRIDRTEVPAVLQIVRDEFLAGIEHALLGSAGKKSSSGDLDIAVTGTTYEHISATADLLGYEYSDLRGIDVFSVALPFSGSRVQVDFMLVPNIDFAKWLYHYPANSEWTAIDRTRLLYLIAKQTEFRVLERVDRETIAWERYILTLGHGVERATQTLRSERTGNITKKARVLVRQPITSDLSEIVKLFFGNKYEPHELLTFEDVVGAKMVREQDSSSYREFY